MASIQLDKAQLLALLKGQELAVEDSQGGWIDVYHVVDADVEGGAVGKLSVVDGGVSVKRGSDD